MRQSGLFFQKAVHYFRMRGIFLDESQNSSHNSESQQVRQSNEELQVDALQTAACEKLFMQN